MIADPVTALYAAVDRFLVGTVGKANLVVARELAVGLGAELATTIGDEREHRALVQKLDLVLADDHATDLDACVEALDVSPTTTNRLAIHRALSALGWEPVRLGTNRPGFRRTK